MSGLEGISPYLSGVPLVVALMAFGFVVGILTGLFGVGGGFLIVPLLNLMFGISWPVAIGSSLAFTIGTSAAGSVRHMRLNGVELRSALVLAAGAILGAVLGASVLEWLRDLLGRDGSGAFDTVMNGLFVTMLLLTAWLVFRRAGEERRRPPVLQRIPLGPRMDLPAAGLSGLSVPGLCLVGFSVGVMKGLLGIGGGVLFMPMLILLVGLTPHQAVGTSLAVVLCSSVAGTIRHGLAGNVNLALAMALLVGSTIGVQLGAALCQRLHGRRLRQYFGVIVFLAAVALAARLAVRLVG